MNLILRSMRILLILPIVFFVLINLIDLRIPKAQAGTSSNYVWEYVDTNLDKIINRGWEMERGYIYSFRFGTTASNIDPYLVTIVFTATRRDGVSTRVGDQYEYMTGGFYTFELDGDIYKGKVYPPNYGVLKDFHVVRKPKQDNDPNNPHNVWEFHTSNFNNYHGVMGGSYYFPPTSNHKYRFYFRVTFDNGISFLAERKTGGGTSYHFPKGYHYVELDGEIFSGKVTTPGTSTFIEMLVLKQRKNTLPSMTILTENNQLLAAETGLNKYKIHGYIRDVDNDSVIITAEIAGITKSLVSSATILDTYFELNFDVSTDQIPNGRHIVKITAQDAWSGAQVEQNLAITVRSRASDNLYITLGDIVYYETLYNDPELDVQKAERWKFIHNQNFFENPIGQIIDHDTWRSIPYTEFSRTGHFKITFQGMDTLLDTPEFQKWSRDSFDILNLYVHRKPVPRFTIAVYSNGTGGFPTVIDETSYDLDKRSLTEGIADTQWSWKESTATTWTSGQPPINLADNRSYDVKLRVQDHQGLWSTPLIKSFTTAGAPILLNKPPVATMTNPSGTQAAPTIFTTQKPILSWNQTDPDVATIFKSFEIQVTNEANTATILSSGTITQNTAATSRSWTVTNDLPTGQKLRVRVRVNDGLVWSAWSAQTWMIINRPPIANFDWSPKPVWEGDTVTLINVSTDPDGDALTYSWNISGPASYTYTSTTTHVSQTFVQPGDYTVRLAVSDGKAQSTMTRTIRVELLTLEADVGYTALWLEHHLSMGHETVTNPKSFYTGEIFVVSAVGSLAATHEVTASLDAIGRDGKSIAISTKLIVMNQANHFRGNLYDPILSSLTGSLPEGQYQIKFRIEYTNGVVKEVSIPLQIIGHVQGATNVHRLQ